jgi:L-seryl-tRNA(Ser) seleniumtransferase
MLAAGDAELRPRAEAMRSLLEDAGMSARLVPTRSTAGGGSLPLLELEGPACAIDAEGMGADELARRLRAGDPPVIARVHDGLVLLDPRTLSDDDARSAAAGAVAALSG